jgi:dTDP-4-dehydrorhamnose 3,5-epimerase
MIAEQTDLPGVLVVRSPVHRDSRGYFTEIFHEAQFAELGLPRCFAQDNHSHSSFNVLRGLHYQLEDPQGKLVRPASGIIFDVAVDIRRSSPTFGKWVGTTLEAGDGRQVWIPPGFAHGFVVLSEFADVTYKCTSVYHAESSCCIRWDDPDIGVRWPIPYGVTPILSLADAVAPKLSAAACFE